MKLYAIDGCPFAQRVAFALREKNVDFETVFFERGKRPEDLARFGEQAKSPTLVEGESAVLGSGVLLEYIEDRWHEPPLLPLDPRARAEVRTQIAAIAESLEPLFARIEHALEEGRTDDEAVASFREQLAGLRWPTGASSTLSLADVSLYPLIDALRRFGIETIDRNAPLRAWFDRIAKRPTSGAVTRR